MTNEEIEQLDECHWLPCPNCATNEELNIDDAIARSGHLLRQANGEDVTGDVAAYEAALLEGPDDDEPYDDDFGRYGRDD